MDNSAKCQQTLNV